MKKYIPLLLLLLLLSCDSIFHEEDTQYIVPETKQEKIDLVNGIYSRLVKVHNEDYFKALIRSDDVNIYNQCGFTEPAGEGQRPIPMNILSAIDFTLITGSIYLNLYNAIITVNSLLPRLSATEDRELKGELYFLRAYSYLKLARLFGTPPLVTDPDVDFNVKKPSFKEVYELIEKDMQEALKLLPDNYATARIPGETPNKGTAKALLAEIYLSWAGFPVNDNSKYAEAARLSGEVIQQAEYYNYTLLPDIADVWNANNRHIQEDIFGLFFDPKGKARDPQSHVLRETENNINTHHYSIFLSFPYWPQFKFYDEFPLNYRKKCVYPIIYAYDWASGKYIDKPATALVYPISFAQSMYIKKWVSSTATLYLLRYAQTLLTYSEASARAGKLDASAYEAVNMIRRRANKLDPKLPSKFDLSKNLSTEQFLDSVVCERAWELCFEPDGRWFDIVRLKLKDKTSSYGQDVLWPVPSAILTEDWYFYKIPNVDRLINPNLE
jgi:tetratricopeptide (TPR) repeat protein